MRKTPKKLMLKSETLRQLSNAQLSNVNGGDIVSDLFCSLWPVSRCISCVGLSCDGPCTGAPGHCVPLGEQQQQ